MKRTTIFIALASALSLSAYANDQAQKQSSSGSEQAQQNASAGQSSQQNSDLVKQAQQKLSEGGKEVTVDGQMGPKTQAALKEFQQERGLQASGQLDRETIAALDLDQSSSAASGGTSSSESSGGDSAASGK